MRLRSAFLIAGSMLALILLLSNALFIIPVKLPPSTPVVYSQPRTELLPPIAPLPTTTTTTTTTSPQPVDTVTPGERVEWPRVAVCEEGGWVGWAGPAYPDSLGISAVNWYGNGGGS